MTNFITPDKLPQMLAHVREGAKAAGRSADHFDVVCRIMAAVDEDEGLVVPLMRRALTAYLTVPQYNKFFREIGYDNEAQLAMDAWKAGDRKKAVSAVPDEMVDSIFLIGSADKCRARLKEYEKAGVTATAIQLSSFAATPEERRAKTIRAARRERLKAAGLPRELKSGGLSGLRPLEKAAGEAKERKRSAGEEENRSAHPCVDGYSFDRGRSRW